MRVGHGYDSHRFGGDGPLVLGGVHIPFERGLLAHSDGDAVIHALCDALLGASGGGDIGQLFPDSDPHLRGADSREFLRGVAEEVNRRGWALTNADLTIVAEKPKLAPYLPAMRQELARVLQVPDSAVTLKATTNEKMDSIGRGEGIACFAVVLLHADGSSV